MPDRRVKTNTSHRDPPPRGPPPSRSSTSQSSSPSRSSSSQGSPPRGPPSWRAPRFIPFDESTPPAPAAGQWSAVYIAVSETSGDEPGRAPPNPFAFHRSSAIVVTPSITSPHHVYYRCVEKERQVWEVKINTTFLSPQMCNYSLLAFEFVAWIPRAHAAELGRLLANMPFPQRGDRDWNSLRWVQKALAELMQAGLLTRPQMVEALQKQTRAASLPWMEDWPNQP